MTDADAPWAPPPAGTEAQQLTGALDRLRTTFRWKALTLGNLLEHLAVIEGHIFEWPFTSAADDSPDALYRMWDDAVGRSRARLTPALIRQAVDGRVGEDPPPGWRPRS
jgi:hypothetical protein